MESVSCPLCGSERHRLHLVARDRVLRHEGEFHLVRCEKCDLIYLNPRPTPSEIGPYYEGGYDNFRFDPDHEPSPSQCRRFERTRAILAAAKGYPAGDEAPACGLRHLPARAAFHLKSRNFIFPNFRPGGRLLDVGCGAGKSLQAMADLGWDATGVDVSAAAVEACRERGLNVIHSDLAGAAFPEASFDVVTMRHSLEHTHDPLATLREARRVLGPDGELIVELPNIASLPAKAFGEYWFGLEPPRHLCHFSARTLARALAEAGLKLRRLRYKSSGSVISRSLEIYARDRDSRLARWLNGSFFCRKLDLFLRWLRCSDEFIATAQRDDS